MKDTKMFLPIVIVIVLAVGGAGFYGGMLYGKKNAGGAFRQANGQFAGRPGVNGSRQGNKNGGMINGEILKSDDNSITIKLSDGGSKIVYFSDKTTISKFVAATKSDLSVGTNVMVSATSDTSGNSAASFIQIRPAGMANPQGQGNRPANGVAPAGDVPATGSGDGQKK